MKFTVVALPSVDEALMNVWLSAEDKQAVTKASDWIETQLRNDPLAKVTRVDDAYFLRRNPLVALCRISVEDRLVTIVDIHRID